MPSDPFASLGEFLTAGEAEALAVQFASGQHAVKALSVVNAARRGEAKQLLADAGLGHEHGERAAGVLRAISGAKSLNRDLTPVWTMPGNEAKIGLVTRQSPSGGSELTPGSEVTLIVGKRAVVEPPEEEAGEIEGVEEGEGP